MCGGPSRDPVGGGDGINTVAGVYLPESLPHDGVDNSYGGVANSWDVFVQNTTSQAQVLEPYAVCTSNVTATAPGAATSQVVGNPPHTAP